ncbi:hypothetical protein BD770DRAFT_404645 [Pilaira anomala]|nr:hypothetical protein BD770DRAFT_404645 [Pilaira anomala]
MNTNNNNNNNCITCEDRLCHVHLTGECLRDLTGEKILELLQMNVSGITPIQSIPSVSLYIKLTCSSFAFAHFVTKTAASIFFLRFEPFPWPERSNLPGLEVKPCRDKNGDTIVYVSVLWIPPLSTTTPFPPPRRVITRIIALEVVGVVSASGHLLRWRFFWLTWTATPN